MDNICYIFGAMPIYEPFPRPSNGDLTIAADGGYERLRAIKLPPDIVLGDFDSLGYVPQHHCIIKHPVMKDDTDTMLAIKTGFERGYSTFVIYGGYGGRLDHTLANLQALAYIAERGGHGYLVCDGTLATAITNASMTLAAPQSGIVSVFCSGDSADGVNLAGLVYPLDDATLTHDVPLGVSNEFTGKGASISVKSGALTVLWQHDPTKTLIDILSDIEYHQYEI